MTEETEEDEMVETGDRDKKTGTKRCPTCGLLTYMPDEHGRHPACTTHIENQVTARPCRVCGGLTSARVVETELPTCSWCKAAEAGIVPPAAPLPRSSPPPDPAERLDKWVHES